MGKQLHILLNPGNFLYISVNDFLRVRKFSLNPKLAHWASKLLKLLAQQENLLVPDYWNGLDFFQDLSWEKVQMRAYERLEAVAICLLFNTLLNTQYLFSAFQVSKGMHEAREECQTCNRKRCRKKASCLALLAQFELPSFAWKTHKKNACSAGQLLRNERWSQERFIFDVMTEIETYHFYLQNVTWLVDQSITLLRQILVKAWSNQRLLLHSVCKHFLTLKTL